jgi:hypothetical protein
LLDGVVIFGICTAGVWAAVGGRALAPLVSSGAEAEAGRAFRQLLLAALALGAAMLLSDRALLAAGIRRPLALLGEVGAGVAQRILIVKMAVVPEVRGRPVLMVLDALGCVSAFAAPLAAARRAPRKLSITGAFAAAAAGITALLASFVGSPIERTATALRGPYQDLDRALEENGITLPERREGEGRGAEALSRAADLVVKRDGSVVGSARAADPSLFPRTEIAADAGLSFAAFMSGAGAALLDGRSSRRVGFTVAPAQRIDFSSLGVLGGFMGTDLMSVPLTLHGRIAAGLAVLPDGEVGRLVAVVSPTSLTKLSETVPLGDDAEARAARQRVFEATRDRRSGPVHLFLAPAPADTVARVVALVQAIASSYDGGSRSYRDHGDRIDVGVTGDRATLEQAAISAGDTAVSTPAAPEGLSSRRRPGR